MKIKIFTFFFMLIFCLSVSAKIHGDIVGNYVGTQDEYVLVKQGLRTIKIDINKLRKDQRDKIAKYKTGKKVTLYSVDMTSIHIVKENKN